MKRGFLKNAKATRPLNATAEPARLWHHLDDNPSPNPRSQPPNGSKVKETQHTGPGSSSSKVDISNVYTTLPGPNDPDGSIECVITPTGLQTLLSTPGYPQRVLRPPHNQEPYPSYEIRESKTHGLGAFATRDIPIGELILSERPLIIARSTFEGNVAYIRSLPPDERGRAVLKERERLMRPVFDRMGEEGRRRVMALCNSYECDESCPVAGRLRTNGFHLSGWMDMDEESVRLRETFTFTDGTYTGLFDELSRVNHSCCPNTIYTFHLPSLSMHLRAAQPIPKGSELFISYAPALLAPSSQRQDHLARGPKLRCKCRACTNHVVSDRNREMIRQAVLAHEEDARRVMVDLNSNLMRMDTSGIGVGANPSELDSVKEYTSKYLSILHLCETECVVASRAYSSLLTSLVMWFIAIADLENAMRYGRKYARVMQSRGVDPGKGEGLGSFEMFCDEERVRGHEKWGNLIRRGC